MPEGAPTPRTPLDADFFQRLAESSPAALIATDAQLNVICWNRSAMKLFGRSEEQMRGQPLASIAGEKRRAVLQRLLERTLRDGQTREFEVEHPDDGGMVRTLMAVVGPAPDAEGNTAGIAAWVRDITNRKRLADQLAAAEKMASLGTLAGGVAHHFNNILGGVATFVDYALTSNDPVSMRRALQMTSEAATRVAKITQSLLSFAEQDKRRVDLADLTEVVLTFVHLVERPLADRGIRLVLDLHPAPIIAIEANRMHHVLGNLLTNSEEAMPEGGEVRLKLHADENWVMLDFCDSGAGIAPEALPLVFEPFFTTKGLLAGGDKANPGLGLSVVHGIITELGGEISATSEPDQGTCMHIRFPRPVERE